MKTKKTTWSEFLYDGKVTVEHILVSEERHKSKNSSESQSQGFK